MTNIPIHIQRVMSILAMCSFTQCEVKDMNSNFVMTNKSYRIYFYNHIIHKMNIIKNGSNKGEDIFDIVEYTYSKKDILKLIEDIQ